MSNPWHTLLGASTATWDGDRLADFGDPAAELAAAAQGAVICPLDDLALLEVSGADAIAFLQGQLSNDVKALAEGGSQLAAYCTPKGRMLALFRVIRRGDAFLLILPRELVEPVGKRLRMFVLRSKVVIREATELLLLGLSGVSPIEGPLATDTGVSLSEALAVRLPDERPRYLLIGSVEALRPAWAAFSARARPAGPAAWRWLDVRAGLPQVYAASQEMFIPQMANLDRVNGLSYTKGCYPGQEIVARMHYLGQLKRRMYRFAVDGDAPPSGAEVRTADERLAGEVVTAAPSPEGGSEGLAVLQIELATREALRLGDRGIRVFPPPYSLE